jgi:spermidine synthase
VVSFTLEVLWTRLLTHVLGGSVYAFGTMLATFLVGIAAGSALAAPLATTRDRARRGFAVAQLLVACLSVAGFVLVDRLAQGWSQRASRGAPWQGVWLCAATLLPSTLAIGATFPLAVRIPAGRGRCGPATARVYA